MKILIASTPATGHLNPLLAIGRILIAEGHEIVGLSGSALRERIEGIGAEFRPLPAGADFDLGDIVSVVPELKHIASWRRRLARPSVQQIASVSWRWQQEM
jgi:UDP:flavonoid glycosyltransferase YjiC (YdhE family)